jgi:hypothetical protein
MDKEIVKSISIPYRIRPANPTHNVCPAHRSAAHLLFPRPSPLPCSTVRATMETPRSGKLLPHIVIGRLARLSTHTYYGWTTSPVPALHLPLGHDAATSIARCRSVAVSPTRTRGSGQTHRPAAQSPRLSHPSQPLGGRLVCRAHSN